MFYFQVNQLWQKKLKSSLTVLDLETDRRVTHAMDWQVSQVSLVSLAEEVASQLLALSYRMKSKSVLISLVCNTPQQIV